MKLPATMHNVFVESENKDSQATISSPFLNQSILNTKSHIRKRLTF